MNNNTDFDIEDIDTWLVSDDSSPYGSEEGEMNEAGSQGQILSIPAGEDWEGPESDGTSLATIAEEVGATPKALMAGLWEIAQNWTKEISDCDGGSITVNNDSVKLEALKTLTKIYMDQKKNKKQKAKGISYFLIRDGN